MQIISLLGALIEEVSKETYSTYIEKHIFQPLRMNGAAANNESHIKRLFNRLSIIVWYTKKKYGVV